MAACMFCAQFNDVNAAHVYSIIAELNWIIHPVQCIAVSPCMTNAK